MKIISNGYIKDTLVVPNRLLRFNKEARIIYNYTNKWITSSTVTSYKTEISKYIRRYNEKTVLMETQSTEKKKH